MGTRQYDRAVAEAQALIEAAPYKAENYLLLGELYARQKKDSLALVQFAEAYRIDSTSVAVLATYSEFYNERRDYASSLNYTRRLFASDEMPLDDKLAYFDRITGDRNFYSTFYLQINDLATTLAMKYPHDPRVVKLYGDHLIASGQLDDALTYYKTHLDDLPPRIDYFNMVIDIESYKQRPDSVEHYTSRAMKLFPENVDLHLRKGQMLSYAKRYDEALKFYKNSLRLAPGDSLRGAVWGIIGETYHLMGQQALQKQSEDRRPKASLYESRKGPAARCMRKCYDAYDRSLALRYDNAMVLNNYAYFLSLEGRDLERYRAQYAAMVREAYRNYKQNSYLTYIFASKDFADVARRIANIRGVAKLREAKLREIAETAQEVGRQQELLAAQQQALDSTRRKIDAQRARYERDQRNAKARLQRMSAREKAVLREKERQEEQLDTAIAELQKLTKGNKAGASFSTRTSNLNLPVEGGRVKRYRDNMAEITGPKGARITAIYEGKVVDVKRNRITNRFDVYIAHGQYITSYANLNSVSVAKGQTVAKNSAIGVIGPAVDIQTMKTEYRLVFGIYPPAGAKKMRASDCFRK